MDAVHVALINLPLLFEMNVRYNDNLPRLSNLTVPWQLFDDEVIAGNSISTEFVLVEYFAVQVAKAILPRLNYGPIFVSCSVSVNVTEKSENFSVTYAYHY